MTKGYSEFLASKEKLKINWIQLQKITIDKYYPQLLKPRPFDYKSICYFNVDEELIAGRFVKVHTENNTDYLIPLRLIQHINFS